MDRIDQMEHIDKKYRENEIDWDDYFYDIIGVSKMSEEIEQVELLFSKDQAPYIKTKPLHPSQKSYSQQDGSLLVKIEVGLNYELETLLLSFGDKVKILKPIILLKNIKSRLKSSLNQY